MILPDGYSDVPAGKIAAVVTHLEMTARPAPRPDPAGAGRCAGSIFPRSTGFATSIAASARNGCGFRGYGCPTRNLAAIIQSPLVEVYALAHDGRDEGLLELDFREPGQCEFVFFGVTAKLIGTGAGRWLMNRALELAWSRPVTRVWLHTCTFDHPAALPSTSARAFVRSGGRSRWRTIRGSMERCRAMWRGMCR